MIRKFGLTAAAMVFLGGPVWAQQAPPPTPAAGNATSQGDRGLKSSMDKMNSQMNMPMTGDTDRDFAAMMLAHHEGAVTMAEVELKDGKDAVLRRMAAHIITTQSMEIKQFRAWQAEHPAGK